MLKILNGFPNLRLALLLGIISFAVYANSIKNGFAVDDSALIVNNSLVTQGPSAIPELLCTPYRHGFAKDKNDLYRPLSLTMFAAEYSLFHKDPGPMHLINVLFFVGCVMLLFQFLTKFFDGRKPFVVFVTTLLFALHPIHTEVVANIKSRDELLCFFFAFLSLNIFMKYIGTGKALHLVLGAFCFLLSFLSKETVISFVFVVPLIFFFYKNEHRQRSAFITGAVLLVAVGVLAVRFAVLSHYHANDIAHISMRDNILANPGLSFESRWATTVLILGYYVKLLIVPYPLVWDYSYSTINYVHFYNISAIVSLLAYLFLFGYAVRQLLQKRKDPFAFSFLFFLSSVALFSNIFFFVSVTLAERFLFLPSVGFCLAIALLIEKLVADTSEGVAAIKQPKVLAVLLPVCVVYSVVVFGRNREWANNFTLYRVDVKKNPNSTRINYLLGSELVSKVAAAEPDPIRQKQIRDEGIAYLLKAASIFPGYVSVENYLGFAYMNNQQYDSAEVHCEKALDLDPNNIALADNLAGLYITNKKYDKGIKLYSYLLRVDPRDASVYANLGICYGNLGNYDSSLYYARRAISMDPANKSFYAVLSATYKLMGNADSVAKYEQMAGTSAN